MKFVKRVDELLVAPPYMLGSPPTYKFRSNVFILDADREKLNAVVKEHLLTPPGIEYFVPQSVTGLWIAFISYDRSSSEAQPDQGWLSYHEAMIGFLVVRKVTDSSKVPDGTPKQELLTYLPVVYIDDSTFTQPVSDPLSVPIMLGREAYGLPKNPGEIRYEPAENFPNSPLLRIWDIDDTEKRLTLADAIRILPEPFGQGPGPRRDAPPPPYLLGGTLPRDGRTVDDPMLPITLQLGLRPGQLKFKEADEFGPTAVKVFLEADDTEAIAWSDLLFRTHLLGLKQFPDPKSVAPTPGACYQAIVESPLEEVAGNGLPPPEVVLIPQIVEFPKVQRVDFVDKFGLNPIPNSDPPRVAVPHQNMYYQEGILRFARPDAVRVWPL